jgi:hypothetical protein
MVAAYQDRSLFTMAFLPKMSMPVDNIYSVREDQILFGAKFPGGLRKCPVTNVPGVQNLDCVTSKTAQNRTNSKQM